MKFPLHCKISSSTGIRKYCAIALLCAPSICWAVSASGPSGASRPHAHGKSVEAKTDVSKSAQAKAAHSAEASPAPAVQSTTAGESARTAKAPKPADAPATPATVSLESGQLTVKANNSDLGEILQKVASISGMKIDGLEKSARVFGAYGPGNPHDILADLLAGSNYNFMMVGNTADGAPRRLLLTAKNNIAPSLDPAGPSAAEPSDNGESDRAQPLQTESAEPSRPAEPGQAAQSAQSSDPGADTPGADTPDADTPDAEPLGPGAVAHPPPPAPEDPQQRMQQKLQQLQKMHEQGQQDAPQ